MTGRPNTQYIKDDTGLTQVKFREVAIGQKFRWKGKLYCKTEADSVGKNAVRADKTNLKFEFGDNMDVTIE